MTDQSITIGIPRSWLIGICSAGAILGCGSAFVVKPLTNWLLSLAGDAPGPLRIAAGIPLMWAIPVLTLVGLALGVWVGKIWQKETGTITVTAAAVTVQRVGGARQISRERISGVFTDNDELVAIDHETAELLRVRTDQLLTRRLRQGFKHFGYPWRGVGDPHEDRFIDWIDGSSALDPAAHDLLRSRQRALTDKRSGAAEDARDALRAMGVIVRERKTAQQYRCVAR